MSYQSVTIQSNPTGPDAPVDASAANPANSADVVASSPETADTSDRPSWLPEKFKSPEDLARAYSELEGKLGGAKDEPDQDQKTENVPEEGPKDPDQEQNKEGQDTPANVDIAALSAEWAENGTLSDTSYADLEAKGFDRDTVNQIAAALSAQAEFATQRITEAAGGKEQLDAMFAWASTSLSADQIENYNKAFEGNDVNAAVLAMEGLKVEYQKANGSAPARTLGGRQAPAATNGYQSLAQITAAMNDPRYRTDPAYRREVEQKVALSNAF